MAPYKSPSRGQPVSHDWTDNRKNLMLFSGRAHPELAEQVAKELDVPVTAQTARDFANGEIFVRFDESVRGCDAFVLQSHPWPLNQWLMEQLLMIDALKRGSAKRITAILPFYPYARQDKKHRGREPISARLVADLLKTAGADPVHKATIMPRGQALGMVMQLPSGDQTSQSRKQMLARLDVCMGGRVAEEMIFGADEVTSGASSDIRQATNLARSMVGYSLTSFCCVVVFCTAFPRSCVLIRCTSSGPLSHVW